MDIQITPIGMIKTPFLHKENCPIQGVYSPESIGTVELYKEHEEGLKDIELFSHIYLIYYFDQAGEIKYVRSTFLDDEEHGIYASRHPCRPNGIGLSIVKLLERKENILTVSGIDTLDQTPLLDIKPYIPRHDYIDGASEGWITNLEFREKPTARE
ncbi:MAG: tRNA (N6-threonylcarbamoyladenosine(37)-N6)-methyltransferase TrmO [Anaerolineaceae bacterium]|nr:tRNA (N6-threonylcarbamoyladenosine(37)-N6)-methyltransferase TrmO [Anaerolineaceae bacterium]